MNRCLITNITLLGLFFSLFFSSSVSAEEQSAGEEFHQETSISWLGAVAKLFHSKPKSPSLFKKYPGAAVTILPKPAHRGIPLEQAIAKRRSVRTYSAAPLSLEQLSQLLFAAQGKTAESYTSHRRAAPSAGALYPIEIYLVVKQVSGLDSGIYHYRTQDHALELIHSGSFSRKITHAGLEQDMLGKAAVTFVLSAVFNRVCAKYGQRGYRYVYIEAGHISQNIYLQATSLGLGSVAVGAFHDELVNELIGVDGRKEAAVYLHAVGAR